ncbi:MAG: uracil-DNA glycosylase [Alphaproteobacteria bacterium]
MNTAMHTSAAKAALQFYLDSGVDEALSAEPLNKVSRDGNVLLGEKKHPAPTPTPGAHNPLLGKSDARIEAVKLASAAQTPEDLRAAIAGFGGIAIKKTATNLVFCDGNPKAPVMLVGEAPGADEDRQGKPFVGVSGQLLDRILKCIDLERTEENPAQSIYISNILNWRPPGNRTPAPAEVEVSLPFIERHIQIIRPKLLIFCGGVSAKALLGSDESVSRLRNKWHDYLPQTPEYRENAKPIPAIATYHPAYLLRTPAQKKAVWTDMLAVQARRRELGLL